MFNRAERAGRDHGDGVELRIEHAQGRGESGTVALGAEKGQLDHGERPAAKVRGQLGQVRQLEDPAERRALIRHALEPFAPRVQDLQASSDRPEQGAGVDLRHGVERELESGDRPEVAPAAADRPEQVGLVLGVRPHQPALGGDDVRGEDAVRREPVLAQHPAQAAAERVADHADVRRCASQEGEAVDGCCCGEVVGEHSRFHARAASRGVHLDRPHALRPEEQDTVAPPDRSRVVAPALEGDPEAVLCRERDGCCHVLRRLREDDRSRLLVDGQVPALPGDVPPLVAGDGDPARQPEGELGRARAHSSPLARACSRAITAQSCSPSPFAIAPSRRSR